MHIFSFLSSALLAASGAEALRSGAKVKLSKVSSLTLRQGLDTSHRRVSAMPQVSIYAIPYPLHYTRLVP